MERTRALSVPGPKPPVAAERLTRPAARAAAPSTMARSGPRVLSIQRVNEPRQVVLYLSGVLNVDNVMELRDVAFTIVGERPAQICLDVTRLEYPVDATSIQALITICRVAKMVKVDCAVRAKPQLAELLRSTGLSRLLPLDSI